MNSCKKCGTCCRKGGPALHKEDRQLISNGKILISNLVTIRAGEPVFSPLSGRVEPAELDILKLSSPDSWSCLFLNQQTNHCDLYENRPLECRLLQCWNTAKIEAIIYKNNLNRWDLIDPNTPIFDFIKMHEAACNYAELAKSASKGPEIPSVRERIKEIIAKDLAIREKAVLKFNLSLPAEMFYFGRPMFKSLSFFGVN